MHFAVSLVVVGLVVAAWTRLCVLLVDRNEARAFGDGGRQPRGDRASRRLVPRQRPRPVLPAGHRPPPGLGPLSPSERFLTTEAARGLRELQLFLVDQRA